MPASSFEILTKPSFLDDFVLLDQVSQKKVRRGISRLSIDPHCQGTKKILKDQFTNLYRLRVDDHRVAYVVGSTSVALLAVGPRDQIYERLRRGLPGRGRIEGAEVERAPEPIPTHPDDRIPEHLPDGEEWHGEDAFVAEPKAIYGSTLFREYLEFLNCPEEAIEQILACGSLDEILELDLPNDLLSKVLHLADPPSIEVIREQPVFELPNLDDLEKYARGELVSFLLRLDEEQEKVARKQLKGPSLVRGGPGTGKSLIALYRIRRLMESDAQSNMFHDQPPKVLFLTFTKALVSASHQMLEKLVGKDLLKKNITVTNVDKIARQFFPEKNSLQVRPSPRDLKQYMRDATKAIASSDDEAARVLRRSPKMFDPSYLLDEFDWVIDGQDIGDLKTYLQSDRSGRGVGLDSDARRTVWLIHERWAQKLREKNAATFVQVQRAAFQAARAAADSQKFDVVVLDEAQDLKPVGIRFVTALAKDPAGLYLTADEKQAIYGRHFSWKSVSEDLDFRGRATVLRRNYRSSEAISDAASQFLRSQGVEDDNPAEAILDGPLPICAETEDRRQEASAIVQHIKGWAADLRVPTSFAVVLVRHGGNSAEELVQWLREDGLNASFVTSGELDLRKNHTRVMTIHSAKGLEFPIVCIPGLDEGAFPNPDRPPIDDEDERELELHEARLFHVAMTRAMRRLLVTYSAQRPSPFVKSFDSKCWEWV